MVFPPVSSDFHLCAMACLPTHMCHMNTLRIQIWWNENIAHSVVKRRKKTKGNTQSTKRKGKIWRVGATCFWVLKNWRWPVTPIGHRMENKESTGLICRVLLFLQRMQVLCLCWTNPWLRTFPPWLAEIAPKVGPTCYQKTSVSLQVLVFLGLVTCPNSLTSEFSSNTETDKLWFLPWLFTMIYTRYWSYRSRLVQCVSMLYKDMSTTRSGS